VLVFLRHSVYKNIIPKLDDSLQLINQHYKSKMPDCDIMALTTLKDISE